MIEKEIRIGDTPRIERTVYKADDGTVMDISSASVKQFIIRKPDGSKLTKSAEFVTDGKDGKLYYQTIEGDIDQQGLWKLQVYLMLPIGPRRSTIPSFEVFPNL